MEAVDLSSGPAEGSSLRREVLKGHRWHLAPPDLRLGSGKLRSCSRTFLAAASSSFTTSPASSHPEVLIEDAVFGKARRGDHSSIHFGLNVSGLNLHSSRPCFMSVLPRTA